MTNDDVLQEVERQLLALRPTLNTATTCCPTCHLHVQEQWEEHQAAEIIDGMLGKIRRLRTRVGLEAWRTSRPDLADVCHST